MTASAPPTPANLNDKWKSLDRIFKAQLEKFVLQSDRAAFDELADEFAFNDVQKKLLFRCIHTFTEDMAVPATISSFQLQQLSLINKALSPLGSNQSGGDRTHNSKRVEPALSTATSLTTSDHPQKQSQNGTRKKSLFHNKFAIPNTEPRQRLSGSKRKRCASPSEERDVDDSSTEKEGQKTKKTKEELQNEKNGIYIIEAIRDHRRRGGLGQNRYEYHVKWLHYDECTWEPPAHLCSVREPDTLREYWQGRGMQKDPEGAMLYLKKKKSAKKNKSRRKRRASQSPGKDKVYACCGKKFKSGQALGGHKAAVHPKNSQRKKKAQKQSTKRVAAYWEDSDDEDDEDELVVEEK